MKQKQENISNQDLDQSNPSGAVQPIEETATFSQVKKVMQNFKKKNNSDYIKSLSPEEKFSLNI